MITVGSWGHFLGKKSRNLALAMLKWSQMEPKTTIIFAGLVARGNVHSRFDLATVILQAT